MNMPQTYAVRTLNAPPAMTHTQRLFTGTATEAREQAQHAADMAGRPSHLCLANADGSVVDPNALERFTPTP